MVKAQKVLFLFFISHLLDIFIIRSCLHLLITEKLMRYELGDQYDIDQLSPILVIIAFIPKVPPY